MEVFTSQSSRPSWAERWDKGRTIWVVGLVPLISDKPSISTFNKVANQNNKFVDMALLVVQPSSDGLDDSYSMEVRS